MMSTAFLANRRNRKIIALAVVSCLLLLPFYSKFSVRLFETHSPLYHRKISRGYSIKPVVYIFPQYYPFPENDRIWGTNFTEWDNVRKVTHNRLGLETIRPDESVGYYNGLDFQTRERQGRFLRENGFYGAIYHHYWFARKPVMDGVLQAMLKDGEPNTPFMLSWANEPWTATWDGLDSSETFIAQEYGSIDAWKEHFEWLLPFFRHPQYIRSEGRVQFTVYRPDHLGHLGPQMFAVWRQLAIDAGLGGIDIIETRWGRDSWDRAVPDAISEFQPHTAGLDQQRHPYSRRIARVYHRGTITCWDTTPRKGDRALLLPTCHPKTWQYHMVEMLRQIKLDPNPVGSENFLFINALNEWGEGNALEPSVQFGDAYGRAMRDAIQISEQLHVWPDKLAENELGQTIQIGAQINETADVCVLVQASASQGDDRIFKLATMLRSLQEQHNRKWRAIVFQSDDAQFGLDEMVRRTLDQRIKHISLPEEVRSTFTEDAGYQAIDWVIENLSQTNSCESAKYLLVTSGANTYEPRAFNSVPENRADLVGLNVESRWTLWNHNQLQGTSWQDRCARLENVS
jgi:Glycosyltransferase WbsX